MVIREKIKNHSNQNAVQQFMPILREAELYILNNAETLEIQTAVESYNEIRHKRYLSICSLRIL